MDNKAKETLMESVIHDDFTNFTKTLNKIDLVLDESYFDYELLKAALVERRGSIANFLIDKGCRVRNPNKIIDETPLYLAMKLEDLFVLSVILSKNASIYDKDIKGDTPLHAAFKERYYSAVSAVLDYITNCDLTFHPDNKDDVVHFHIACIRKHIASVKRFLSLGFDVNSYLSLDSAEFSSMTPLHYLISKNDYGKLFKILLEHSDLTIKNSIGLTPLHCIYYNYESYDFFFELPSFCKIMSRVFKYGNDTKFMNSVDNSGVSHFHLGCSIHRPDIVKKFIDSGVDVNSLVSVNCSHDPGFTPLHFAVKYCTCIEVVELLLKNGADCNRSDKNGETPLHLACQNVESDEVLAIIELLMDYSACPDVADNSGNTPKHLLFDSVLHHRDEEVNVFNKLMFKLPIKVNLTDEKGLSYFHIACTRNEPSQVNDYLNSGATIDSVASSPQFRGYTALHFAVAFNQKDVVELLLKRNAQINIKTSNLKDTPLHLACQFTELKYRQVAWEYEKTEAASLDWISSRTSQLDIIKLLLLYGADVEAENFETFTPLFSAFNIDRDCLPAWSKTFRNMVVNEINTRLIEITNILLSYKPNINCHTNDQQLSIFHVINSSGLPKVSDELMECLVTAGADINAVNKYGLTPLHFAAQSSKKELVQSFLKYKANVNVKCKRNETPLEKAIEKYKLYEDSEDEEDEDDKLSKTRQLCVITILLENGSNVNVRNPDGISLLHDAVSRSSAFLIENLLKYGADINVEDMFGCTPVCSLLNNDDVNMINVSYNIFIHVQKLLALGLYVSDKVQTFRNYYLNQYCDPLVSETTYNKICSIFNNCLDELNRMKNTKIDNYTSLYNILLKDPHQLSKHVKSKTLMGILEEQDIDLVFPQYSYLLKLQYKKGLLRRDVLKDAKSSLVYVISSNLPDLCYDSILRYLSNEEIVNLKAAAATKGCYKRKLSDGCSYETEPSTKIQKRE